MRNQPDRSDPPDDRGVGNQIGAPETCRNTGSLLPLAGLTSEAPSLRLASKIDRTDFLSRPTRCCLQSGRKIRVNARGRKKASGSKRF
jgi:hypothetical protein